MLWDVFCRVIDNFGDVGVCWRLCADLANRGQRVRLWLDDLSALPWMAPGALEGQHANITVHRWLETMDSQGLQTLEPAQVWIEAFGCEIEPVFISCFKQ
ncbi:MAG: elongation factor P maturation arginine rhamnosyltransferase EarP, partial [Rhodoferax sp.]|nr:elongation factor P maturation arginine rhamnosyltransferase EarP [Rhodoferax sp.]